MTPREKGFLLLTSHLGDPNRKPLTAAQFRTLAQRMRVMETPAQDRDLTEKDLIELGYGQEMAGRILSLLEQEDVLRHYCRRAKSAACVPLTRVSDGYPGKLRKTLGLDSPGCLWAKGDISILSGPAVALVGSRELRPENEDFAKAVGTLAAWYGYTLVSGNARGADKIAQETCLNAGGRVVSIVADRLDQQPLTEKMLYLSEDGYSEVFSPQRALSRNRCIHALGQVTFVAQTHLGKGGSWDGTVKNLRHGWSTAVCFRDESQASRELEQMGAWLIGLEELKDFFQAPLPEQSLFDENGDRYAYERTAQTADPGNGY